jgi:O-antigen/teichoic acid export membrane protein
MGDPVLSSATHSSTAGTLTHVPEHQRRRVLGGMRWSVWLSCVAVPFGATINLLLARVGPETIGVYGLLSVYVGMVSAFLYFGGDTVVIKFTPECNAQDRVSFLLSYLLLILIVIVPWLALAFLSPSSVSAVLGKTAGERGNFILLCLAPIPIVFHMVVACLKGLLEIKFSQALAKMLVLASLLAYGVVLLAAPALLIRQPQLVIWGIYLGFTASLALIGTFRIWRVCGARKLRLFLPKGFWRYAVDTQMVSATSFLAGRLDYVLILNFGGLANLGRYVAIMTVATAVPLLTGFFMDTLLPSLTNMVATRNDTGAAQVFMMHMRILFLVGVAASCAVMVLAEPAVYVMGAQYRALQRLIIVSTLLRGIATPGPYGGTLLASVGRQRLAVWTGGLQIVVFAALFLVLWHRWALTGAVIANGLAATIYGCALMSAARQASAGIYPSITALWTKAAAVQFGVGVIALWEMPLGLIAGSLTWLAAMSIFFYIAGYNVAEFRSLARVFTPGAASIPLRV